MKKRTKIIRISLIGILSLAIMACSGGAVQATLTLDALEVSSSGALTLNALATSNIVLGGLQTSGQITIGRSGGTGTIIVGSSNGAQTVEIGTGTGQATINIGTGIGDDAITIGDTTGASASSLELYAGTGNILISTNAGTGETISIVNTQGTGATAIALTATAGGITITGDTIFVGTTPVVTIGDNDAEDAALVYDGVTQEYYIALDDAGGLADDVLTIGLGTVVGSTPILGFNATQQMILENKETIDNVTDNTILLASNDNNLIVTIQGSENDTAALWLSADEGADAGDDWKLTAADSGDFTLTNDHATPALITVTPTGSNYTFGGEVPKITIGDGGTEDTILVYDGVVDYYIAIDDAGGLADDVLTIGYGSTVGTNPILGFNATQQMILENKETIDNVVDNTILFTANDNNLIVTIQGSTDDTAALWLSADEGADAGDDWKLTAADSGDFTLTNDHATPALITVTPTGSNYTFGGEVPKITIGDAGTEDTILVYDGVDQDFYIGLDDGVDDLFIGLGAVPGATPAIGIDEDLVVTIESGYVVPTEDVTAVNVISATETGTTFFLNSGTEFVSTLPDMSTVEAGVTFTFIVKAAPASADYTVITGNSLEDLMIGGINELETDTNTDGPYINNGDTITFADGVAVVGDYVTFISDGTSWYFHGQANAAGGVEPSKAD